MVGVQSPGAGGNDGNRNSGRSRPASLLAKVRRPSAEGSEVRHRVFELLDDAHARRPVIWVGAPAGAGKTTVATTWIEARGLPCLWYQVGEEDNDLATFFYYLGLALAEVEVAAASKTSGPLDAAFVPAGTRPPLPLFTSDNHPAWRTFSRLYFQELFDRLPRPSVLVFDNMDPAYSGGWLQALTEGIELLPPDGVTVVLLSRGGVPPSLSRLIAQRRITIIAPDALRLDPEESKRLARGAVRHGLARIESQQLSSILEVADGWAAGLVLLLELAQREHQFVAQLSSPSMHGLFDYFATQVFERVEPDTQRVLLETALLPSVTSAMAASVTGLEDVGRVLDTLRRQHLFTEFHPGASPSYTYHPAFRAFLIERLRSYESSATRQSIAERCARVLLDAGETAEAVRLLLAEGLPEQAVAPILACAESMREQGRTDTLAVWLAALPAPVLARHPWLLYWRAVTSLPTHPAEARRQLEQVLERFVELGDGEGAYTTWAELVEADASLFSGLMILSKRLETYDRLVTVFPSIPTEALADRVGLTRFNALGAAPLERRSLDQPQDRLGAA